MEKISLRREWIIILALIIPLIYIAIIWNKLPERIPTHFDIHGKPNAYGSKAFGTLLLPAINIILYFVLLFIPRIDPRYKNYATFQKSYYAIRLITHIFFAIITIIILQMVLTGSTFGAKLIVSCVFLMLAFIGNYIRTVRPNFFVGIRTPWTLSNEEVWKRTHEIGGRLLFYGGIVLAILGLVLPDEWSALVLFPILILLVLYPVVYSYIYYRRLNKKSSSDN